LTAADSGGYKTKKFGSTTVYDYHTLKGIALSVPDGKTVDETI